MAVLQQQITAEPIINVNKKVIAKVKKRFRLKELEVASSPWKLALGLMFRPGLPKRTGMLFDLHYRDRHAFWMLFMRFPIDIYFLDADGNTVDAVKGAIPLRLWKPSTWKLYRPSKPCRYAVEVSSKRPSCT